MFGSVVNKYAILGAFHKKIRKVLAVFDYLIYDIFQLSFPTQSLTAHISLPIGFACTCFGVFHYRQMILLAYLIWYTANFCPCSVTFLALIMLSFKGFSCHIIGVVENDMRMDMLMIFMYYKQALCCPYDRNHACNFSMLLS